MWPTQYAIVLRQPMQGNLVSEVAIHVEGDSWLLHVANGVANESYITTVSTDYVESRSSSANTIRHATKSIPARYLNIGDVFRYRGDYDGKPFKVIALEKDADFTGHLHAKILQPEGENPYMEPCYIPLDQMVVKEQA